MRKKETVSSMELDRCVGDLAKRFGKTFVRNNVKRYEDEMLSLSCVQPEVCGNTGAFEMPAQERVDSGQDFVGWTYGAGGTVALSWLKPKPEWGEGFFRVGNQLAGARLKAGLTQAQLAHELGIRQNMVSDYENGRRTYSDNMAKRLSLVLKVKEDHLKYGSEPEH